ISNIYVCIYFRNLGQIISSSAQTYAINSQNHVCTNLAKRLLNWIRWKLEKQLTFLDRKQLNAISSHLLEDIKENNAFSFPQSIDEKINDTHKKIFIEIRSGWKDLFVAVYGDEKKKF